MKSRSSFVVSISFPRQVTRTRMHLLQRSNHAFLGHIWGGRFGEFPQPVDFIGRGSGIRTRDPLLPKQVLYQAELCPDTESVHWGAQKQFPDAGLRGRLGGFGRFHSIGVRHYQALLRRTMCSAVVTPINFLPEVDVVPSR
jgi:hypothetical protein